jgi:hypothetical protein
MKANNDNETTMEDANTQAEPVYDLAVQEDAQVKGGELRGKLLRVTVKDGDFNP